MATMQTMAIIVAPMEKLLFLDTNFKNFLINTRCLIRSSLSIISNARVQESVEKIHHKVEYKKRQRYDQYATLHRY